MNFDGDLSVDTGHHVTDQVRERLFDLDVNARNLVLDPLQQLRQHLLAILIHLGIHAQDVFAEVDRRRVLVHLRSTGAPDEVEDLAVGVGRATLHRQEHVVDVSGHLIGRLQ